MTVSDEFCFSYFLENMLSELGYKKKKQEICFTARWSVLIFTSDVAEVSLIFLLMSHNRLMPIYSGVCVSFVKSLD